MRRLLLLVAASALLLSGCGSLSSYAAKVNGHRITQEELQDELEAILDNPAYLAQVDQGFAGETGTGAIGAGNKTFTSTFVAALLDRRIGFELIHQELLRRKVEVTDEERDAAKEELDQNFGPEVLKGFPARYRRELEQLFSEVAALQKALADAPVSDQAVADFYESNAEAFDQSCSRHILVDTSEKAAAIKGRIDAGEDFALIAQAESGDRGGPDGGSAGKGGDLGCTPRGSFVPEFQAALDALRPGQVAGPVQTQFGYHVIQLTERKTVTLAEAAPDIRAQLSEQAASGGSIGLFVNQAVGKADIEVNPRYGRFERGLNPGVKPPKTVGAPSTTTPGLPLAPPGP